MRGWKLADGLRSWRHREDLPAPLTRIRQLHSALLLKSIDADNDEIDDTINIIREITQLLVLSDKSDMTVVDYFLEKDIHQIYLVFLKSPHVHFSVAQQVLQSLNIIFENLRNETTIYYFLSKFVNQVILLDLDFTNDEITSYYVNFLRTCSLKLSKTTLNFFFNDQKSEFTLFTRAIRFLQHPDLMIRTAIRSLTLNVFRIEDSKMTAWFMLPAAAPYFDIVIDVLLQIVNSLKKELKDQTRQSILSDLLLDHMDELHYINDTLSLAPSAICDRLCKVLIDRVVFPVYVNALVSSASTPIDATIDPTPNISPYSLCLMLLLHIFQVIHHTPLINFLGLVLLRPILSSPLNSIWLKQTHKDGSRFDSLGRSIEVVKYESHFDESLIHCYEPNGQNVYRSLLLQMLNVTAPGYSIESCILCIHVLSLLINNPVVTPETLFAVGIVPSKTARNRILFSALTNSNIMLAPPIKALPSSPLAFTSMKQKQLFSSENDSLVADDVKSCISVLDSKDNDRGVGEGNNYLYSGTLDDTMGRKASVAIASLLGHPAPQEILTGRRPSFHAFVRDQQDSVSNLRSDNAAKQPHSNSTINTLNVSTSEESPTCEILNILFGSLFSLCAPLSLHIWRPINETLLYGIESMILELSYYRGTVFAATEHRHTQLLASIETLKLSIRSNLWDYIDCHNAAQNLPPLSRIAPDATEMSMDVACMALRSFLHEKDSPGLNAVFRDIEASNMTQVSKDGRLVTQQLVEVPQQPYNMSIYLHRQLHILLHLHRLCQTIFTETSTASSAVSTSFFGTSPPLVTTAVTLMGQDMRRGSSSSIPTETSTINNQEPSFRSQRTLRRHHFQLSTGSKGASDGTSNDSDTSGQRFLRRLGVVQLADVLDSEDPVRYLARLLST